MPRDAEPTADFLRQLQTSMQTALPAPVLHHTLPATHVPSSLATATHMFVRNNAHCQSLQRPYDGPFRVLQASDKTLVIDRNGEPYTVSINRVNVAVGEAAPAPPQPTTLPQPPVPGVPSHSHSTS
jgi:hypothetical protein